MDAAKDLLYASELLPGGTDQENAIRDRFLARASYYMGVSCYYRDEAAHAREWFADVENHGAIVYPPELIEKWQERCKETQGPPKEASYYRDPSYGGKRKKSRRTLSRHGSDKPHKPDPEKGDPADDGDDGHGGCGAGVGS